MSLSYYSDGYLLIGNPTSSVTLEEHISLPLGFIREGAGAVALYKSHNIKDYYERLIPTQTTLVDVVVYGMSTLPAVTLVDDLLPAGQQQVSFK